MPVLKINGHSVRVAEGRTILDAARGAPIGTPTAQVRIAVRVSNPMARHMVFVPVHYCVAAAMAAPVEA